MNKISSLITPFYKKGAPALWFGGVSIFLIHAIVSPESIDNNTPFPVIIVPLIMLAADVFIFKKFIIRLADEVYLDGNQLYFKMATKKRNCI